MLFNVSILSYAHRVYKNLLLTNILVNNTANDESLTIQLNNNCAR